jgi:hypothetical protein
VKKIHEETMTTMNANHERELEKLKTGCEIEVAELKKTHLSQESKIKELSEVRLTLEVELRFSKEKINDLSQKKDDTVRVNMTAETVHKSDTLFEVKYEELTGRGNTATFYNVPK